MILSKGNEAAGKGPRFSSTGSEQRSEGAEETRVTVPKDTWSLGFKEDCWVWWSVPFLPALGRQRQAGLCEFEASFVYPGSSTPVKATQRDPVEKGRREQLRQPRVKSFES